MSQYSKAIISIDPGRIDHASVVPLSEDKDRSLLTIVGSDARIVIEAKFDDLWKIATACRDAVKRYEEECRMDDLAAEVEAQRAEPVSEMRSVANHLLREMAR